MLIRSTLFSDYKGPLASQFSPPKWWLIWRCVAQVVRGPLSSVKEDYWSLWVPTATGQTVFAKSALGMGPPCSWRIFLYLFSLFFPIIILTFLVFFSNKSIFLKFSVVKLPSFLFRQGISYYFMVLNGPVYLVFNGTIFFWNKWFLVKGTVLLNFLFASILFGLDLKRPYSM